ncbi:MULTISPECIES: DUF1599 domain-containing protein [unclassified Aureispira]|uniref:DUF1599 domain-containing protein n=1 Tax=unclassified Aureispira TaxID=2649989 RepID=UPI000699054C|nr:MULTISPECIES: DUF1599 domain-containing protein [unclassified Aureispira]WMX14058.1 DUF1599 domain-containing protein [Aureispira sp. CCB-E]
MPNHTFEQYLNETKTCRTLFLNKNKDYGTAWRILRPSSLTDQLFIKAKRIREIEIKGSMKVDEGVKSEYIGLVNYCIMALIQLELPEDAPLELSEEQVIALYDKHHEATFELMKKKNHDYGEAWRDMRRSSLTDLILMKIFRVKQIEDNKGATLVSEGLDANYQDIINYAVFALIKIAEEGE